MGINLKEHKDNSSTDFQPLPEDRYTYKILDAEIKRTSTNKDMISTTFEVQEGPYKGRLAWNNFVLTENSMGFLVSFLAAAGSTLIEKEDVSPAEIAKDIKGKFVSAFTQSTRTTQDKPVNQLSRWQPVRGLEDAPAQAPAGGKQPAFV